MAVIVAMAVAIPMMIVAATPLAAMVIIVMMLPIRRGGQFYGCGGGKRGQRCRKQCERCGGHQRL